MKPVLGISMMKDETSQDRPTTLRDTESDNSQQASWLPTTGTGKGGERLRAPPRSAELRSPALSLKARAPSRRTASQPNPDGRLRLGNVAGGAEEGMQLEQTMGPPTQGRGAEGQRGCHPPHVCPSLPRSARCQLQGLHQQLMRRVIECQHAISCHSGLGFAPCYQ